MKALFLFLFPFLCTLQSFGDDNTKPVQSTIASVTVFLKGAQVTRTGSVVLSPGTTYLSFTQISPHINQQSIQVKGEGNFTVLSVVHHLNFLKEQNRNEEIVQLQVQQEALRQKLDSESNMMSVYQQEEEMLVANKSIGGQNQGVKVAELREAADFYRARLTDIKLKQLEARRKTAQWTKDIEKLQKQLVELNAQKDLSTSEIVVAVSAKANVNAKLTLSYLVENAGWYPTYDLRVKDVESPIALIYKANVYQSSGEDWNQVRLTISTGDPAQNGTKPTLQTWNLGFYSALLRGRAGLGLAPGASGQVTGLVTSEDGEALPGVSVVVKGTTIGTSTNAFGHYTLALPGNAKTLVFSFIGYTSVEAPVNSLVNMAMLPDIKTLSEVVVTGYSTSGGSSNDDQWQQPNRPKKANVPLAVTQFIQATNVEFQIELPYTIPTDGKQYTVDMEEHSVPAIYEYYCAPKLETDVFLTAKIVDWEAYNLLEGEANLYFEGTYLGKSVLDVRNVKDTLELSLGRDKNIVVTRTKLKDFSRKKLLGSNQTETRAWDIEVRNKKKQKINLVVEDQFPISTTKEIQVDRIESPEAQLDEDTGKLTWKFELGGSQSKKLGFKYAIKYPKDRNLLVE